jgi:hypothetical protein
MMEKNNTEPGHGSRRVLDDDLVILGCSGASPEDKKKLIEMARTLCDEIDQEEKKQKKRNSVYRPRGARQMIKQADPDIAVSECLSQAGVTPSKETTSLARHLYDLCSDKDFVIGTLRCVGNPNLQSELLEYLNSHDALSTQDIAQFAYCATCR